MSADEDWVVNVKKISKKLKLNNLIAISGDNYKNKQVIVNKEYLTERYNSILRSNFSLVNFNNNNNYLNFTESELSFLDNDNIERPLTLGNFNKITYNNMFLEDSDLETIKLKNSTLISCFKIKNNKKILNVFIYEQYVEKLDKTMYIILSYFDRKNIHAMVLTNYLEVLLYLLKFEYELNKNYKYSSLVNKYPHEFNSIHIQELRIYFNNLSNVWIK
jgi:hypothetical protein